MDTVTFRAPCPCGALAVWVATRKGNVAGLPDSPPATEVRCPCLPDVAHQRSANHV